MEELEIARKLNDTLIDVVSDSRGYGAVHCLLIHWADADDAEIATEVRAMRSLFEKEFNYTVSEYLIPSENPSAMLQMTLLKLCMKSGSQSNPLLILYYAGHGDENADERRSIWAA